MLIRIPRGFGAISGTLALIVAQACAPAPPTGTTADSAAAAAFLALIDATPDAERYCLAVGNPAFYRDPGAPGVPSDVDPSPALLALARQGRARDGAPLAPASTCERASGNARVEISHLLPLGDTLVHVTAMAGSRAGRFLYSCRVVRRRGMWMPAAPCRRDGIVD